jgi:hypothetical protein
MFNYKKIHKNVWLISKYSKIVPNHIFSKLDWLEYRNKRSSISRNQETFLKTLLKTTDKISASGSINGSPIPGISLTGKGTAYIKGEMTKFEFLN